MDNLFFIASKLVWGFLSPSNLFIWCLLLATVLVWCGRVAVARRLLSILALTGLFVMAYPVSDWLMSPLESRFSMPSELPQQVDGIIVLGGAEDLKLSAAWSRPQVGESAERVLAAAELSRLYPDVPIIYSGGSNLIQMPELSQQGETSRALLIQAGIDPNRIFIEPNARNTYENFIRLKPLLPDVKGRYLLVTSAFHMPRSVGIAHKQAISVIPYPVDYRSSQPQQRYWDFDLSAHLNVLETAWREWIGLTVYYLTGKSAAWFPKPIPESDKT